MVISPEEKLLRLVLKKDMDDKNKGIKQETPVCPRCYQKIDISDFSVSVDFRDVELNGKLFAVADSICPNCGITVSGRIFVEN